MLIKNLYKFKCQSLIFIENKWSNLNEEINFFLKTIICLDKKNDFFCNKCSSCQKIDKKNYFDLHWFNAYKNNLKKEDIAELQNLALFSSIEKSKAKFLVIRGIEKLNRNLINSLLKMLEEPPSNFYFIFSTRNIHSVYLTIKSRCLNVNVLPDKDKAKKMLLEKFLYSDEEVFNIINSYYSLEEFLEDKDSNYYDFIKNFTDDLFEKVKEKKYGELKKNLEEFKKIDYYNIEKIFLYLYSKINNEYKKEYLYFLENLNFNLSKVLIFNKLLSFLE